MAAVPVAIRSRRSVDRWRPGARRAGTVPQHDRRTVRRLGGSLPQARRILGAGDRSARGALRECRARILNVRVARQQRRLGAVQPGDQQHSARHEWRALVGRDDFLGFRATGKPDSRRVSAPKTSAMRNEERGSRIPHSSFLIHCRPASLPLGRPHCRLRVHATSVASITKKAIPASGTRISRAAVR